MIGEMFFGIMYSRYRYVLYGNRGRVCAFLGVRRDSMSQPDIFYVYFIVVLRISEIVRRLVVVELFFQE